MRILLFGACGRMGKQVAALSDRVTAGVDLHPSPMPFPVYRNAYEAKGTFDCVIDFSSPLCLKEKLAFLTEKHLPAVLAFTGESATDRAEIEAASKLIPIFKAANLSVGIALLNRLVKEAAASLQGFDAEIVERHHKMKKDAPSGTALLLKESVGRDVPVHSVRAGTVSGVHEVYFAGDGETLSLVHTAQDPSVFAAGALRAAAFLLSRPQGLYGMDDLLVLGKGSYAPP